MDSVVSRTMRVPLDSPTLISIKNTFLEFSTEEMQSSSRLRRVKSAPDMLISSQCAEDKQAAEPCGSWENGRVGNAWDTPEQCEQVIQDTFLKFGWPIAFRQATDTSSTYPGTTISFPPAQPTMVDLPTIAQIPPPPLAPPRIPPPPAAPPCLPSSFQLDESVEEATSASLPLSPCTSMLASVLRRGAWSQAEQAAQEESLPKHCPQGLV